jgi:hypothetical protein
VKARAFLATGGAIALVGCGGGEDEPKGRERGSAPPGAPSAVFGTYVNRVVQRRLVVRPRGDLACQRDLAHPGPCYSSVALDAPGATRGPAEGGVVGYRQGLLTLTVREVAGHTDHPCVELRASYRPVQRDRRVTELRLERATYEGRPLTAEAPCVPPRGFTRAR